MRIPLLLTALLFAGMTAFAACAQEGEEGAVDAADTLAVEDEDGGGQVEEALEETVGEAGEAIGEGVEETGEAIEEAAEEVNP
jgi:hypothetical protein